ncbi:hypothetical protein [Eleftheria terrae]|uniref:hypothetical protein n=1 Tax=Eleftheria terrae TaxID=1597781 RepID=UPI00263B3E25|nr:hypothetical protein [Eleftheria terrae]WKB53004.1 hypothetical protein N7L95_00955 [Eleftheria terrae]
MKYRKKPVVIDAWRIDYDAERPDWVQAAFVADEIDWDYGGDCLWIDTPEGTVMGGMGDMLIRGVKGELYPCRADIFLLSYEAVVEGGAA